MTAEYEISLNFLKPTNLRKRVVFTETERLIN